MSGSLPSDNGVRNGGASSREMGPECNHRAVNDNKGYKKREIGDACNEPDIAGKYKDKRQEPTDEDRCPWRLRRG